MRVYSAMLSVAYEGEELLGVFGSREQALEFIRSQEGFQRQWASFSYGLVESELGQPVDFDRMVDWVE
jgi:hypothetical protein